MHANTRFEGVIVPIVSPCDEQERLDHCALANIFKDLVKTDIHGMYICGGTGDAEKLTPEERMEITGMLVPALKKEGKTSIVHVGQANLRTAAALAEHAAQTGADAVAAIPPRAGWDGARLYYERLAQAGLPVFVYYIPGVTGMSGRFEDLAPILAIPGVAGIKISDWNIFLMQQIKQQAPDKIIFNGFDEMLLPGLLYGAHGCIGSWGHLFPQLYTTVFTWVQAGCIEKAYPLHQEFTAFLAQGWKYGVLPYFEALMQYKGAKQCFRKPLAWPAAQFPDGFIAAQWEAAAALEAKALALRHATH